MALGFKLSRVINLNIQKDETKSSIMKQKSSGKGEAWGKDPEKPPAAKRLQGGFSGAKLQAKPGGLGRKAGRQASEAGGAREGERATASTSAAPEMRERASRASRKPAPKERSDVSVPACPRYGLKTRRAAEDEVDAAQPATRQCR